MTAYADAIAKPPRTLTELEQKLILKTTGEHRDGFRDHVLISLALGTGLREHELLALDMGDVFDDDGRVRSRRLSIIMCLVDLRFKFFFEHSVELA
jgi:integrase